MTTQATEAKVKTYADHYREIIENVIAGLKDPNNFDPTDDPKLVAQALEDTQALYNWIYGDPTLAERKMATILTMASEICASDKVAFTALMANIVSTQLEQQFKERSAA